MEKILLNLKKSSETVDLHQLTNDEKLIHLHMIACREGHADIVGLFLSLDSNKGEKNASTHTLDINSSTPLHLACESGREQIVSMLVLSGADIFSQREGGIPPMHSR